MSAHLNSFEKNKREKKKINNHLFSQPGGLLICESPDDRCSAAKCVLLITHCAQHCDVSLAPFSATSTLTCFQITAPGLVV